MDLQLPNHSPRVKNICELPTEIIENICSHLPRSDIISLRQTNGRLSAVARSLAFKKIYVRPFEDSFERIKTLCKDQEIRKHIKSVCYFSKHPPLIDYYENPNSPRPGFLTLDHYDKVNRLWQIWLRWGLVEADADWFKRYLDNLSSEELCAHYINLAEYPAAQKEMFEACKSLTDGYRDHREKLLVFCGHLAELWKSVLAVLPDGLDIEWSDLPPSEYFEGNTKDNCTHGTTIAPSQLFPKRTGNPLIFPSGTYLPAKFLNVSKFFDQMKVISILALLLALADEPRKLSSLSFRQVSGFDFPRRDREGDELYSRLLQGHTHLTGLRLWLIDKNSGEKDFAERNMRTISEFAVPARNLQSLDISFVTSNEHRRLFWKRCIISMPFAQMRVWPQLKHLSLSNLATPKDDLIALLKFHGQTLQTLELGNITLSEQDVEVVDKCWIPTFMTMRRLPFLKDVTLWGYLDFACDAGLPRTKCFWVLGGSCQNKHLCPQTALKKYIFGERLTLDWVEQEIFIDTKYVDPENEPSLCCYAALHPDGPEDSGGVHKMAISIRVFTMQTDLSSPICAEDHIGAHETDG